MQSLITKAVIGAAALAAVAAGTTAYAHHAIQAQFDTNKVVPMEGTLTKVDWINPHAWFHFEIKDSAGKATAWRFETPGPGALRRAGLSSKAAFPVGQTYKLEIHPSRNGEEIGFLNTITYADGRKVNIRTLDPAAR
jgi:hypothetical protein